MTTPHPWRAIPEGVHVHIVELPDGIRGATDGINVWLSRRLGQRDRRSTLAHELRHLDAGHTSRQPPAVEKLIRTATARWLLPDIVPIGEALAWAHSLEEAAEELWVSTRTLRDRLEHLHPSERHHLSRRLAQE